MLNAEQIAECAMQVTAYAGAAKSSYLCALQSAKKGNHEESANLMAQGDEGFAQAHLVHCDVLVAEMESLQSHSTLFMSHAEDQLMAAETIKILVTELMDLLEKKETSHEL